MIMKNIELNKIYGIKNNPYYFKPVEILKRKQKENTNNFGVVKGYFSTTKNNFNFALIKYFKPEDIVELNKEK